ncbi:BQ5605_C013g07326 [Microbotryum silenes-dioicae]|uniref:BQ5605_C013g07326 protein n=1 Tax=Microbotryum silenes-dioicae TaxID=796604 RepID=A0A2X0MKZ0_9BASI|nr:BQ5605_C013g07326 [Microbotryum silenes-dioicae]
MGNSPSKVKITSQDRSILDLKLQRDKLRQFQQRIQVVLLRESEIASLALQQGNKSRALIALRQKKYQQSLLTQTDQQLETLQKLVQSIEFSLVEQQVLFGLQQGNEVLKQLNQEMDLNKVEQLMSDTAEAIAYQEEVSQILSSKITADEEDEVLAELEALQAEQLRQKVNLPHVPTTILPEPTRVHLDPTTEEEPKRQKERRQAMLA